ncbi:hypothetical protein JYU34_022028 [Plutella xylostella]|uniref:RRM domain-containing protein n=1 Tax=Plutella xylostella TaxID=51655 RepID=A0ABQ7PQM9_PLUXY|nr:hypothetical protein JYU34_022028 [Plutella xylostella]
MSFPPRPPLVPYGIATGMVTMPMTTHMMVGAYGSGSGGGLLPAPSGVAAKPAVIARGPTRNSQNGGKAQDGPPVTVFIGNITPRAPDPMIRALLSACGPVLSWKRVSSFGFCEFLGVEAALRCVRLLHGTMLGERALVAKTDGKMQPLVDSYKTEQRSRLTGSDPGSNYLDARQLALDEAAARRVAAAMAQHQHHINNYEVHQKEEQIEKTNRALEEADIEEEKRDVIHREIGKFRESMKRQLSSRPGGAPRDIGGESLQLLNGRGSSPFGG